MRCWLIIQHNAPLDVSSLKAAVALVEGCTVLAITELHADDKPHSVLPGSKLIKDHSDWSDGV